MIQEDTTNSGDGGNVTGGLDAKEAEVAVSVGTADEAQEGFLLEDGETVSFRAPNGKKWTLCGGRILVMKKAGSDKKCANCKRCSGAQNCPQHKHLFESFLRQLKNQETEE